MKKNVLKVHPADNVIVALQDLKKDETVHWNGSDFLLQEDINAKHKFTATPIAAGDAITMYGVLVARAKQDLPVGIRISTENITHASGAYQLGERKNSWHQPDVTNLRERTFNGFHRNDGSVGTANYWLVIPMVFWREQERGSDEGSFDQ